jgi:hypothetical protein
VTRGAASLSSSLPRLRPEERAIERLGTYACGPASTMTSAFRACGKPKRDQRELHSGFRAHECPDRLFLCALRRTKRRSDYNTVQAQTRKAQGWLEFDPGGRLYDGR